MIGVWVGIFEERRIGGMARGWWGVCLRGKGKRERKKEIGGGCGSG